MKRCEKCKVTVAGPQEECPLCQGPLLPGEPGREVFPDIPTVYSQHSLFFKILLFLSIVAGVVSLAVNWMIPQSGIWSLMVVAGIGCAWLTIITAVFKRKNLLKNMTYQVVLISLLAAGWDFLTGWRGWSIDYVIPILCMSAMVAMSVIAKVNHLKLSECAIYFVLDGVFGIVPLVFILTKCLHVIYPSMICVAGSVISLAALLVFEGKNMLNEMKKRLHV